MDEAGERIDCVRVTNDPVWFDQEVSKAPKGSDVVIEATYGWYWAFDLLSDLGYRVHLSNPHGNGWGKRRVKNDERTALDLADLLRLGRLAEAWIAPPSARELRELVRFRYKMGNLRTRIKTASPRSGGQERVLPGSQRHAGREWHRAIRCARQCLATSPPSDMPVGGYSWRLTQTPGGIAILRSGSGVAFRLGAIVAAPGWQLFSVPPGAAARIHSDHTVG
jgi:hypothetical protein